MLVNGDNVKISSCSRTLNEISVTEIVSKNHPMHLFLLKLIALCCYLRLFALLVLVLSSSLQWHARLVDAFIWSLVFDFCSRYSLSPLLSRLLSHGASSSSDRVFCYWLYGSSDQLDFLSSSLASLGDRLAYFSISLSCLLTLFTSSLQSFPLPTPIASLTAIFSPSLTSIDSSILVVLLSATMVLEIASSWMYLTAEVDLTSSSPPPSLPLAPHPP
jgi:hypothetical protein